MAGTALDSNNKLDQASITSTGKSRAALYVFSKSGESNNHRIGIEVSPDGVLWMDVPGIITGHGYMIWAILAEKVRPKVYKAEGGASEVEYHLLLS